MSLLSVFEFIEVIVISILTILQHKFKAFQKKKNLISPYKKTTVCV
jgi:hypothetical protein